MGVGEHVAKGGVEEGRRSQGSEVGVGNNYDHDDDQGTVHAGLRLCARAQQEGQHNGFQDGDDAAVHHGCHDKAGHGSVGNDGNRATLDDAVRDAQLRVAHGIV